MHLLFRVLAIFQICAAARRVVCYYNFNEPSINEIPIKLCSHIILIGSAGVTKDGRFDPKLDEIREFSLLKLRSSTVRLLICVTAPNPNFSFLTSSKLLMTQFAFDSRHLIESLNIDGVDIDWEFPVWSADAKKTDRAQFGNFLEILHRVYEKKFKILSVAVSGPPTITKVAYDIDAIKNYVDMIQVMNYDFHVFDKFKNPLVGFNAPLHPLSAEISVLAEMNSEASMRTWFSLGLPSNRTYFGLPTYGRAYQLLTSFLHKPYSPAVKSLPQYSSFGEICPFLNDSTYKKVWENRAESPYLYGSSDKIWITYENRQSLTSKVAYARQTGAHGVMVFSISSDDGENRCGLGRFPLLRTISNIANKLFE